ncbi:unnamed protein product [Allacma fusca]|uniref:C2H2-type domain-containing protein n=1 Tax=Allacma fusca TaxID=39272 RepID=A0A8J2JAX0_9HEXA|nr:unnamed protein product [Allacma fusca]
MRHKHPDKPLYERKYDPIFYRNEIKCPICKKTFSKVFVWNNHMRSNHPGSVAQPIFERVLSKKPYQCSVCHSHFTGQWRFKKHIMEKHPDPFAELSPQEQDIEEHQQGLNPGTHFIVSESFVNEVEISSSNS